MAAGQPSLSSEIIKSVVGVTGPHVEIKRDVGAFGPDSPLIGADVVVGADLCHGRTQDVVGQLGAHPDAVGVERNGGDNRDIRDDQIGGQWGFDHQAVDTETVWRGI